MWYQFSIALDGKFLFRTDWEMVEQIRLQYLMAQLTIRFPKAENFSVTLNQSRREIESIELDN